MTMEISDNPELQTHLVAQMGQGATAGNVEAPKQSDVASFRSLSGVSTSDDAKSATLTDEFGNSKNSAALPEVHNAGNAQQSDRSGSNVPAQQDGKGAGKAEGVDEASANEQAMAAKLDAEAKKQDKISALMSRIQQLEQQLSLIDVQISSINAGQSSSGGNNSGLLQQLTAQKNMLAPMIQSLRQELLALQSE